MNRNITLSAKCGILFGGFLNQFGWLFFGLGMIFFWMFAMHVDLSFIQFRGEIENVEGMATEWVEMSASINEQLVIENHYTFTTDDGMELEEFSYSTGSSIEVGKPVNVEYPAGKPQYSRIVGMRREIFGAGVLFVVLFPLFGLIVIGAGLKKGLRMLTLLKQGEMAYGTLVSKEPTSTKVNDQMVYKLTFSFKDLTGATHEVSDKTHCPELLEDDREERLLYLRDNPECALLIDSFPTALIIDDVGDVAAAVPIKCITSLGIPFATLLGHGAYICELMG